MSAIKEQRFRIRRLIEKNPSLRPIIEETIQDSYPLAVMFAVNETNIVEEDFPRTCPYTIDEVLNGCAAEIPQIKQEPTALPLAPLNNTRAR